MNGGDGRLAILCQQRISVTAIEILVNRREIEEVRLDIEEFGRGTVFNQTSRLDARKDSQLSILKCLTFKVRCKRGARLNENDAVRMLDAEVIRSISCFLDDLSPTNHRHFMI